MVRNFVFGVYIILKSQKSIIKEIPRKLMQHPKYLGSHINLPQCFHFCRFLLDQRTVDLNGPDGGILRSSSELHAMLEL